MFTWLCLSVKKADDKKGISTLTFQFNNLLWPREENIISHGSDSFFQLKICWKFRISLTYDHKLTVTRRRTTNKWGTERIILEKLRKYLMPVNLFTCSCKLILPFKEEETIDVSQDGANVMGVNRCSTSFQCAMIMYVHDNALSCEDNNAFSCNSYAHNTVKNEIIVHVCQVICWKCMCTIMHWAYWCLESSLSDFSNLSSTPNKTKFESRKQNLCSSPFYS